MIVKFPEFLKSPHALAKTNKDEPVLVALSGGADSVSLLHLLCELRKASHFPLYAAHVNHGIRTDAYGNEAARDEEFCKKLCESLEVELFTEHIDVPALSKDSGKSLETAAREARYAFFAKIMRERSIKILATAHNADDNFETQLFNLCRGCGIDGLCGIPETRPFTEAEATIVRPILSASKRDILDFCYSYGFDYVTDSTNLTDDCTRNKLRLNIIPQLKEIFGSPERSGSRLAEYAKEDSDFIRSEAEKLLFTMGDKIDCAILRRTHPSIAKRVIRTAFEKHSDEGLESVHTESMLNFVCEGKNGSLSLPDNTVAVFEDGYLSFRAESDEKTEDMPYLVSLFHGINFAGNNFAISLTESDRKTLETCPEGYRIYASARIKAKGELSARNRREGDTVLSNGMHKKLKKLMCDKKVPTRDRNGIPLIISNDEIIYAPLCAVSDNALSGENKTEYKITVYKK